MVKDIVLVACNQLGLAKSGDWGLFGTKEGKVVGGIHFAVERSSRFTELGA